MNNMLIRGLSNDGIGLIVRTSTMEKTSYWHVHSDEMTPYQRTIHKKLVEKK